MIEWRAIPVETGSYSDLRNFLYCCSKTSIAVLPDSLKCYSASRFGLRKRLTFFNACKSWQKNMAEEPQRKSRILPSKNAALSTVDGLQADDADENKNQETQPKRRRAFTKHRDPRQNDADGADSDPNRVRRSCRQMLEGQREKEEADDRGCDAY